MSLEWIDFILLLMMFFSIKLVDIRSRLAGFEIAITTRELNYLMNKEFAKFSFLTNPACTRHTANAIVASAKSAIKSRTRCSIKEKFGYFIDGKLHVQGQPKVLVFDAP